ncbi:MAG: class I SAM-dependent methyltransferase [Desulfobacterales bacterium]
MEQSVEIGMEAEQYDRWYKTSRGRWIGQRELELLSNALRPQPGESLLDIGCGTGFFTRKMAGSNRGTVIGIDINPRWVDYARRQNSAGASYVVADAGELPFKDNAFDLVMSVAALCFIADINAAIREMVRVTRRRFAVGLLNRHSLLWFKKGRHGGHGAYRGAQWLTVNEVKSMFSNHPVKNLTIKTAVHLPGGGLVSQHLEQFFPSRLPTGAFILIKGDVLDAA